MELQAPDSLKGLTQSACDHQTEDSEQAVVTIVDEAALPQPQQRSTSPSRLSAPRLDGQETNSQIRPVSSFVMSNYVSAPSRKRSESPRMQNLYSSRPRVRTNFAAEGIAEGAGLERKPSKLEARLQYDSSFVRSCCRLVYTIAVLVLPHIDIGESASVRAACASAPEVLVTIVGALALTAAIFCISFQCWLHCRQHQASIGQAVSDRSCTPTPAAAFADALVCAAGVTIATTFRVPLIGIGLVFCASIDYWVGRYSINLRHNLAFVATALLLIALLGTLVSFAGLQACSAADWAIVSPKHAAAITTMFGIVLAGAVFTHMVHHASVISSLLPELVELGTADTAGAGSPGTQDKARTKLFKLLRRSAVLDSVTRSNKRARSAVHASAAPPRPDATPAKPIKAGALRVKVQKALAASSGGGQTVTMNRAWLRQMLAEADVLLRIQADREAHSHSRVISPALVRSTRLRGLERQRSPAGHLFAVPTPSPTAEGYGASEAESMARLMRGDVDTPSDPSYDVYDKETAEWLLAVLNVPGAVTLSGAQARQARRSMQQVSDLTPDLLRLDRVDLGAGNPESGADDTISNLDITPGGPDTDTGGTVTRPKGRRGSITDLVVSFDRRHSTVDVAGVPSAQTPRPGIDTDQGTDAYPPSQSALAVAAMQSTLDDRVTEFDQPVQPRRDANMTAEDAELLLLLADVRQLNFDPSLLAPLTNDQPLLCVTMHLMARYALFDRLHVNLLAMKRLMTAIEHGYRRHNPYHNKYHATDVVVGINRTLRQVDWDIWLVPFDMFCGLYAAAIHDFDHPGVNNQFLKQTTHLLALRYNDRHVLENHHVSAAFRLMRRMNACPWEDWPAATKQAARQRIIDLVLATDLADHNHILDQFKSATERMPTIDTGTHVHEHAKLNILMWKMALKCGDLGHAVKPWHLHERWSMRVIEEMYRQGDRERQHGSQVSAMMDRNKLQAIPTSQVGFIDFICAPLFDAWAAFAAPLSRPSIAQLTELHSEQTPPHPLINGLSSQTLAMSRSTIYGQAPSPTAGDSAAGPAGRMLKSLSATLRRDGGSSNGYVGGPGVDATHDTIVDTLKQLLWNRCRWATMAEQGQYPTAVDLLRHQETAFASAGGSSLNTVHHRRRRSSAVRGRRSSFGSVCSGPSAALPSPEAALGHDSDDSREGPPTSRWRMLGGVTGSGSYGSRTEDDDEGEHLHAGRGGVGAGLPSYRVLPNSCNSEV